MLQLFRTGERTGGSSFCRFWGDWELRAANLWSAMAGPQSWWSGNHLARQGQIPLAVVWVLSGMLGHVDDVVDLDKQCTGHNLEGILCQKLLRTKRPRWEQQDVKAGREDVSTSGGYIFPTNRHELEPRTVSRCQALLCIRGSRVLTLAV